MCFISSFAYWRSIGQRGAPGLVIGLHKILGLLSVIHEFISRLELSFFSLDRCSIPSREVSILWSYLDITLLFSSYVYHIACLEELSGIQNFHEDERYAEIYQAEQHLLEFF